MIFEERTKLYAPLLQLNIHVHFELVYYILDPPGETQKKLNLSVSWWLNFSTKCHH